jgi:hypothetical protein
MVASVFTAKPRFGAFGGDKSGLLGTAEPFFRVPQDELNTFIFTFTVIGGGSTYVRPAQGAHASTYNDFLTAHFADNQRKHPQSEGQQWEHRCPDRNERANRGITGRDDKRNLASFSS